MAGKVKVIWSDDALADLKRFSNFLERDHPGLAPRVADEIVRAALALETSPMMGRAHPQRPEFRRVVLQVLKAAYIVQYRLDADGVLILRVYHGREDRSW